MPRVAARTTFRRVGPFLVCHVRVLGALAGTHAAGGAAGPAREPACVLLARCAPGEPAAHRAVCGRVYGLSARCPEPGVFRARRAADRPQSAGPVVCEIL